MSEQPPATTGQRSPDGRYFWDGQAWQPVQSPPRPAGSIKGKLIALGIGLGILPVLISIGGFAQGGPGQGIGAFAAVLGVELAYFLPTIVASLRSAPNTGSIFVLNLFLGWSILGWIIPLAMAVRSRPR